MCDAAPALLLAWLGVKDLPFAKNPNAEALSPSGGRPRSIVRGGQASGEAKHS
jgi:hypothetical protein